MKRKIFSILLVLVLVLSFSLVTAVPVSADSYSTNLGRVGWGGSLFEITDVAGLNWNPLTVEVTYADGKATFVITSPVAFNPEIWVNDNFWLRFDTDNDGVEDFQVGYMTKEPGTGGWPEYPTEHWFTKSDGSGYQPIPGDWDVSETDLSEFTVSIPVSYLGGFGSDYWFQIGLVKHVNEADWQLAGGGNWPGDPGTGEGWSTQGLIFVQLPSEGWESWESEVTPPANKADILKDSGVPGEGLEKAPGQQKPFNPDSKAGEHAGKKGK